MIWRFAERDGCGNRAFTLCSLAFRETEEYKRNVSSMSSGGNMTPPGLELHHS